MFLFASVFCEWFPFLDTIKWRLTTKCLDELPVNIWNYFNKSIRCFSFELMAIRAWQMHFNSIYIWISISNFTPIWPNIRLRLAIFFLFVSSTFYIAIRSFGKATTTLFMINIDKNGIEWPYLHTRYTIAFQSARTSITSSIQKWAIFAILIVYWEE